MVGVCQNIMVLIRCASGPLPLCDGGTGSSVLFTSAGTLAFEALRSLVADGRRIVGNALLSFPSASEDQSSHLRPDPRL